MSDQQDRADTEDNNSSDLMPFPLADDDTAEAADSDFSWSRSVSPERRVYPAEEADSDDGDFVIPSIEGPALQDEDDGPMDPDMLAAQQHAVVPLAQPRADEWAQHIRIDEEYDPEHVEMPEYQDEDLVPWPERVFTPSYFDIVPPDRWRSAHARSESAADDLLYIVESFGYAHDSDALVFDVLNATSFDWYIDAYNYAWSRVQTLLHDTSWEQQTYREPQFVTVHGPNPEAAPMIWFWYIWTNADVSYFVVVTRTREVFCEGDSD